MNGLKRQQMKEGSKANCGEYAKGSMRKMFENNIGHWLKIHIDLKIWKAWKARVHFI